MCHPGTVYGQRDLRPLLTAMAELREAGIDVILDQVGTVEEDGLALFLDALNLNDRVFLHGRLSHAETIVKMRLADAFVVSQPGTRVQVPSKIFEMLPFQRPILGLADADGGTARMITEFGLGRSRRPRTPPKSPRRS